MEATLNRTEKPSPAQRDAHQPIAPKQSSRTRKTGMALALIPKRCEMVAAFTNPTLHRTISQHFFISTAIPEADGTAE
jgi:hypothetical protein